MAYGPRYDGRRGDWVGPPALLLPMYVGHKLVAVKQREIEPSVGPLKKPLGSGGWTWPLYPAPQRVYGWTWLFEGEFDALRVRSLGLPATSVTGGCSQRMQPLWMEQLRGLRVHVMFDVGREAQKKAQEAVEALNDPETGVTACYCSPRRLLRLTKRNADVSDYLNAGGDPARLERHGTRWRSLDDA